jgi:hypothetical protein
MLGAYSHLSSIVTGPGSPLCETGLSGPCLVGYSPPSQTSCVH